MHKEMQFEKNSGYYGNTGEDLINLVPKSVKKVLDVGCGHGLVGKRIKEMTGAEVVGIEVDVKAVENAKLNLDKVVLADIETGDIPFEKNYFDCVIFADVLEHFANPWLVLKNISQFMAKGCHVIISLPNVGHWLVVKDLLKGKWDYADSGTMDVRHLRFFTMESACKMLEESGFSIEKSAHRLVCGKFFRKLNKLMSGKFDHLLAWQHLIVAIKK